MTTLLIVFALACFALLASFRPEWGVYLIVLLLPAYQIRFALGSLPLTFLESLILILALIELVSRIRHQNLADFWQNLIRPAAGRHILILLFLLGAGVSIAVSPVPVKAAGIFKAYFLEGVLFYFLILAIIDTEQKLSRLWQTIAVLVSYLSVFGIYQFVTLQNLPFTWWAVNVESRRITSLLNHPNALALLLGPLLAALLALPKSRLSWLAIGFGTFALYLSFSRAAWLALLTTVILLGLFSQQKKKILAGGIAALVLILVVPFSRAKLIELLPGNAPTQENRYVLWSAAASILKKSPVLGAGLMGFHEAYKNYPLGPDRVVQNYPHNFFLNFWIETGLLGLLALIGLLFLFYKKIRMLLRSKWRTSALASGAGMTMILLHGLVDVPYFKNDLSVLFWLIYSLPFLSFFGDEKQKSEKIKPAALSKSGAPALRPRFPS